jgi:23S rRNA pseudouridine2605 synthase
VQVNGRVRRDPEAPVALGRDRIEVEGSTVAASAKLYLALNKPRGVVTTASDEKGRATVYGLLNKNLPWLAPVGRLDRASEGLLLFTNDSDWAASITAPQSHLEKTYHVQINRVADEDLLSSLRQGVRHPEAGELRVRRVSVLRTGQRTCWLEVTLDEGRNRHIRRMLEAHQVEVLRLVRVAIGPLALGELAKGASRTLTAGEKAVLDRALALRLKRRKA